MKNQKTSAHGRKRSVFQRGMQIKEMKGKGKAKRSSFASLPQAENGKFGILFPNLPGYAPTDRAIKRIAETMREDPNTPNNSTIPLAFAFFGQFIDHDLTLEPVSRFDDMEDPLGLTNFRTPALDLDSIYGANPDVARHLYDTYGNGTTAGKEHQLPFRLLVEDPQISIDLQRNRQGTAVIGDPRNDENLFISQLHRMIIEFHNQVILHLIAEQTGSGIAVTQSNLDHKALFEEARRLVTLHYHWIIKHEFLPHVIGQQMTDDIVQNGRQFYKYEDNGGRPFIPIEFAGAAYRFGHTLIRETYNVNDDIQNLKLFEVPFFGLCLQDDCGGRLGVPDNYNIDWQYFVDFNNDTNNLQFCRKIDASVTPALFDLPFIEPTQDPPTSLPERNMRRARTLMLPSGQEVAQAMQVTPLSNSDLGLPNIVGAEDQVPLWFYILKEGELQTQSTHLGEVGGRIVGEVLLGIIEATQQTLEYFDNQNDQQNWTPDFASADGTFTLKDLVTFKAAGFHSPSV